MIESPNEECFSKRQTLAVRETCELSRDWQTTLPTYSNEFWLWLLLPQGMMTSFRIRYCIVLIFLPWYMALFVRINDRESHLMG